MKSQHKQKQILKKYNQSIIFLIVMILIANVNKMVK